MKLVNKCTQESPITGFYPSAGILEYKNSKTGDKKESLLFFVIFVCLFAFFFFNPNYSLLNLPESHVLEPAEEGDGSRYGPVRGVCKSLRQLLKQCFAFFFHAIFALYAVSFTMNPKQRRNE